MKEYLEAAGPLCGLADLARQRCIAFIRPSTGRVIPWHLRDDGRDIWDWITKGAYIYVCGDALRMAKDVERALIDIVAAHGKRSPEDAARYVAELKKNDRYQLDVY